MSEAQVAKLESLLERVRRNRRPLAPATRGPLARTSSDETAVRVPAGAAHPPARSSEPLAPAKASEPPAPLKATPEPEPLAPGVPASEAPSPLRPPPASGRTHSERAVSGGATSSTAPKAAKPTPMEQALEVELGQRDGDVNEGPEIEIAFEDDDGPEVTIDELDLPEEGIPTAPLGTRAPPTAPTPQPAPMAASTEVTQPHALELAAPAQPTRPIAHVVARPEPRTFGELLARSLALRPR